MNSFEGIFILLFWLILFLVLNWLFGLKAVVIVGFVVVIGMLNGLYDEVKK